MSSEVFQVKDKSGKSLWLRMINGYYYPSLFNAYACEHIVEFPMREDDVLLVTYPKTGVHWSWEILRILVTGDISNTGLDKESYMMEWRHPDELVSLPSPRILNNHMPFHLQPSDMLKKKPKVVLFYRNLKDVAVSFYHHHSAIKEYEYESGDFGAYLQRMVDGYVESGNPFKFHKEWEEAMEKHPDLPVYLCAYEDMKENPVEELRKMSEFLGKNYDEKFLQEAASATNFDHMKKTKGPSNHPIFYRKGQVGDWKNHFTVAQNEWFDSLIQSEMAGTRFKFRYTLD